jgi:hypothetical protein
MSLNSVCAPDPERICQGNRCVGSAAAVTPFMKKDMM